MEVRPGYQQSDVGVIPHDWEVKNLGSIGTVIRGASPRPKGDKRYYGGDIPRLMVEDVTRDKKLVTPQIDSLTEEGAKRSRPCKKGTLTIVCSGTPGVVGLPSFLAVDACIHDGMLALINLPSTIVPDYLFHQLSSYQATLYKAATHGGTFVNLTTAGLRAFSVALPPTNLEQHAIATALSDVDSLLDGLTKLIAKKRDLKQATMQQLLTGQARLPGFSGEWKMKRLGDLIVQCFSGATPRRNRPEFYQGNIRWITSGELNYNVITDTLEKISDEAVSETNLAIIPAGTFLMAITGLEAERTRGSCGIVGAPSATNQSCMAVFPTNELKTEFLFHYYVFRGKSLALQYCQGTKQQSYTAGLVKQLPIELPPSTAEQTAIATVLSDMDTELAALGARLAKTRALKQGMMQELLTGKTRLV